MSDVIETEAKVIEQDVAALSGLDAWLAETKKKMDARAAKHMVFEVTDHDTHQQARRELQSINADIREVESERKSMTRILDDAKKRAMAAQKEAAKSLTDIRDALKANDDQYKADVIAMRKAKLTQDFEDAAPDLALPLGDGRKPLVTFDKLYEVYGRKQIKSDWLLFGTNDEQARVEMMEALTRIADAEQTIDSMVSDEDRDEVRATFFGTLDLDEAMRVAREAKERRERYARLEQERREREELERQAMVEPEPQVEPEVPVFYEPPTAYPEPPAPVRQTPLEHHVESLAQPMPSESVPEYVLFAYVDRSKKDALVAFCKQNGIKGSFRTTNGRRFKLVEE